MFYENNDTLREYLKRGAAEPFHKLVEHCSFLFDELSFSKVEAEVRAQFPKLSVEESRARAAFRLLTSGAPPSVAQPVLAWHVRAREWTKAKAAQAWPYIKIAWAVIVLALLVAILAHAEPTPQNMRAYRNATRGISLLPQQPSGLILQFQQSGSPLATRPAGLVAFNCSTNLTCSWSGNTFTLTSTGGGGSGCVPSGGTASALLYDTGSGACNDVAKITWNNGTYTLLGVSGLNADFSAASTFKFKFGASSTITNAGGSGQALLSNGDGTATFADPIVSGPDARAAAQTKNPVTGLAGIDYGTGCGGAACVQEGKIDSSGNLYIGNFPAAQAVTGTFWQATQPVSGTFWQTTQPVSCTAANCPMNVAQFGGTNVVTGTGASGAGVPRVTVANDSNILATQSGAWTVQPGNTANTTAWLVTGTGGTFPATQSGNWTTRVVGNAGASVDGATNAAPPANALLQGFVAATALPSATTATDTVAPMADKFGRAVHIPITVRDLVKMAAVQTTNATQANLLAGQGAGVFADLISLFITSESSTACTISLTDGTTTYKINVANSQGSGSVWAPPTPVPAASANTAWQVTGCASVTLDYNAQFALNK